ncbi:DUF2478 domain-containing protein [Epibacterium sp. SM1969]|uniref:DUF2478 domain-containing protein n=1 Tax=Tritonibacter aquimaris TaxID=2663379 RepID=A0A844B0L3_9RHOB|nr:DUF2478 domain-containing protein [Tritonibacter aquimaris]MQY43661.1 DUF2478 domain-containing protein [Tritonibacter aquimaris]
MHLAYIKNPERGATDRTLTALAARLQEMGIITAGIVQINVEICDSELCDMDVRVLPGGETIRISQSLGPNSTGCRLNPEALEKAVGLVLDSMQQEPKPQVLLVNKFGKHEADGRGMRVVIAEALEQGLPVVLGVNGANVDAFQAFTGGLGEAASCDVEELASWVKSHLE